MKKILAFALAIIAAFALSLPCFAEEIIPEDIEEVTEPTEEVAEPEVTEPVEETPAESEPVLTDDFSETEITSASAEKFTEIINSLTPDAVAKVQELILSGVNAIDAPDNTFWGGAKDFVNTHPYIATISAFAVVAICGVLYLLLKRKYRKADAKANAIMTNNAVEIAKQSAELVDKSNKTVAGYEQTIEGLTDRVASLVEQNDALTQRLEKKEEEAILREKATEASVAALTKTLQIFCRYSKLPDSVKSTCIATAENANTELAALKAEANTLSEETKEV